MSLTPDNQFDLMNASIVYANLLEASDPMRLFSEHIYPVFKDEDFKECYSEKGRNAISPALLSLVTILQWKENLSDMETAHAFNFRIDWKIALHLKIDAMNQFDASTLCRFRRRLLEHEKASLMFDKILNLCIEKGFVKKRGKQRVDATHIVKHVNRIATTDLLFRSVKALVEEFEKKFLLTYEEKIPIDIKERYEKKFSSFGMSKERRGDKQAEIVQDGFILEAIAKEYKITKELDQLQIMLTIFQENIIIREKEVNGKIFIEAEEIQSPKQSIFDPRDPSIQMGVKRKGSWVGAKCQVIETAEPKGSVNFITGVIEEPAQKADQKSHEAIQENNDKYGLHPEKMFADSNYISGQSILTSRNNSTELMGYMAPSSSKKTGFNVEDFKINFNDYSAVCPAGIKSKKTSVHRDGRRSIFFNKANCLNCLHFSKCVNLKNGKAKILTLSKYYLEIFNRRKLQETKEFRNEMKARPAIEGTISELVRFHGFRKIRYKGQKGRQFQCYVAATALNIRRFFRALSVSYT